MGLLAGLVTAIAGWSLGWMPLGLHPGTVGLVVNLAVVAAGHWVSPRPEVMGFKHLLTYP